MRNINTLRDKLIMACENVPACSFGIAGRLYIQRTCQQNARKYQCVRITASKRSPRHVNARGGYYGNTLQATSSEGHAASSRGHEQVVRLLVEKGPDVDAQGGRYGNALQASSSRGHEQIVRLLAEKGADINAQGEFYKNAELRG